MTKTLTSSEIEKILLAKNVSLESRPLDDVRKKQLCENLVENLFFMVPQEQGPSRVGMRIYSDEKFYYVVYSDERYGRIEKNQAKLAAEKSKRKYIQRVKYDKQKN